jgi:hypothetical protein
VVYSPGILEDASAKLSGALRVLLAQMKLELDHLQMRIDEADAMINRSTRLPARSLAKSGVVLPENWLVLAKSRWLRIQWVNHVFPLTLTRLHPFLRRSAA